MKTTLKTKTKPKTLVPLNDISDASSTTIEIPSLIATCQSAGLAGIRGILKPEQTGLEGRPSVAPIIGYSHEGKDLALLLVTASIATCHMFPSHWATKYSAAEKRDILSVVDGWLVVTMSGGPDAFLCFSVVRKASWLAAGKPLVIDVAANANVCTLF